MSLPANTDAIVQKLIALSNVPVDDSTLAELTEYVAADSDKNAHKAVEVNANKKERRQGMCFVRIGI